MSLEELNFPDFCFEELIVLSHSEPVESEVIPAFDAAPVIPPPSRATVLPSVSKPKFEELVETPLSEASPDFAIQEAWEMEMESMVNSLDEPESPLPANMTPGYEELIKLSAVQFNKRAKELYLDQQTIQYLKVQRKRYKNRLAAHRSRSHKFNQVIQLEKRVNDLLKENSSQKQMIQELRARIEIMEKNTLKRN